MDETLTVATAKDQFSALLRRVEYHDDRILIERHGKPVAALVPLADLRRLERLEDEEDIRDAHAALAEAARAGTIPLDHVLRKHRLEHLIVRERPPRGSVRKRSRVKR